MTTISPSILAADFMNLKSDIDALKGIENLWLHLDVMDGHFVPNHTFGIPVIKQISNITAIPLDTHLMVTNPEFHMEELKDCGIHNITFHYELDLKVVELIKKYADHYKSIGISIKPKTQVSELSLEILKSIDLILVMSVEPGFGGQSFMSDSLAKISELKKLKEEHGLNFEIQVDGGINNETAIECITAGANNLVAGSYIFKNEKNIYKSKIESLRVN